MLCCVPVVVFCPVLCIGKSTLTVATQILSTVTIQGYTVELLFHVVPDHCLSNEIMIHRDLIALGFKEN